MHQFNNGDKAYVIYRNPHTQNVATIQEAVITESPENNEELSLFLLDTHYPLQDDYAIYTTYEEAVKMYNYYFEDNEQSEM
ncbi:transcriptional regulator SplA domain-containing protein [Bacillus sp. FJAT-44742]|uniref:transcriptional regulator SplA domain-containing protein n=1 Tax=Bacillus sp. FJAT-44742 TaxID=2014005 RepID=UPI000C24180E|nr:transcriptional regulator SplA domain-containing protein [Bacillus sp. FJAT-44742]